MLMEGWLQPIHPAILSATMIQSLPSPPIRALKTVSRITPPPPPSTPQTSSHFQIPVLLQDSASEPLPPLPLSTKTPHHLLNSFYPNQTMIPQKSLTGLPPP